MPSFENTETPVRWHYRFAETLMIVSAALLFSMTTGLPHLTAIAGAALLVSFFIKNRFEYNDRTITYGILICLVTAVISDMVFPLDKNNYLLIGGITSSNITAPTMIFMAAAATYFKFNRYCTGISISLCLTVLMLASDIMHENKTSKDSRSYAVAYTVLSLLLFTGIMLILQAGKGVLANARGKRRVMKASLIAAASLLTAAIAFAAMTTFRKFEKDLILADKFFYRLAMFRYGPRQLVVFGRETNLNSTVGDRIARNSSQVVLRAFSRTPPGYMRGRCYNTYRRGIWSEYDSTNRKLRLIKNEDVLTFNTFTAAGNGDIPRENRIDILPSQRFSSDVLIASGDSLTFDLSADALTCTDGGVLVPSEWDMKTGYTIYRAGTGQESAFPEPNPPDDPTLLEIPESAENVVEAIVADATKDNPDRTFESESRLADFYVSYFNKKYSYKIHGEIRKEKRYEDPLAFFFREKSGHCEFFATAMALVLRKYGIPARYVTGFVCEEKNSIGNYYIARVGNAHAWTEAWLADQRRWILIEPTPPDGISNFRHQPDTLEEAGDSLKTILNQMLINVRRGYFAKAVIDFFSDIFNFLMKAADYPAILTVILVILLASWGYWRRMRRIKAENPSGLSGTRLEAMKAFSSVLKTMARTLRIKPPASWTVEDWLSRLKSQKPELRDKFAALARRYQEFRFSSRIPDSKELADFLDEAKNLATLANSARR